MNNRAPKKEARDDSGDWINTYADMITLVLTFFVLLFSFSTIDAQKWQRLVSSLTGAPYVEVQEIDLGENEIESIDDYSMAIEQPPTPEATEPAETADPNNYEKEAMLARFDLLYEELKTHLEENGLEYTLNVEKKDNKIILRMSHSAFFDSGRIALDQDTQMILLEVCGIIDEYRDLVSSVQVEGHTDNMPIRSSNFEDNWDLSVLRATNVLRFVVENMEVGDIQFVASGYGEMYPIASNETEEGRAQNRRVDFVILSNIED